MHAGLDDQNTFELSGRTEGFKISRRGRSLRCSLEKQQLEVVVSVKNYGSATFPSLDTTLKQMREMNFEIIRYKAL